jgi:hypothetical protein
MISSPSRCAASTLERSTRCGAFGHITEKTSVGYNSDPLLRPPQCALPCCHQSPA